MHSDTYSKIGSQAISGALGNNYIAVGVGTLSQCVGSLVIGSLLDAKVFINAEAEALENSLLHCHLCLVFFSGYSNHVFSIGVF